jgi:hypothetical protein
MLFGVANRFGTSSARLHDKTNTPGRVRMFMHGSWSHILGNMMFLWAFGREIEDAMNPLRYSVLYLVGGLTAMLAQVMASPHSTVPGRERGDCSSNGRVFS